MQMKHHKQHKKKITLILFLIGILLLSATVIATEQSIKLIDISIGDTEANSACIFKVNGKTVVVDRRDKVTVNDITIYVQEVYPINSESKIGDRCKFTYYGLNKEEEKETKIEKEIIGEKIVQFYFGTLKEEQTEETKDIEEREIVEKTIGDNTIVRISGYDVTGLTIAAEENKEQTTTSTEEPEESKGIFSKLLSWMFG